MKNNPNNPDTLKSLKSMWDTSSKYSRADMAAQDEDLYCGEVTSALDSVMVRSDTVSSGDAWLGGVNALGAAGTNQIASQMASRISNGLGNIPTPPSSAMPHHSNKVVPAPGGGYTLQPSTSAAAPTIGDIRAAMREVLVDVKKLEDDNDLLQKDRDSMRHLISSLMMAFHDSLVTVRDAVTKFSYTDTYRSGEDQFPTIKEMLEAKFSTQTPLDEIISTLLAAKKSDNISSLCIDLLMVSDHFEAGVIALEEAFEVIAAQAEYVEAAKEDVNNLEGELGNITSKYEEAINDVSTLSKTCSELEDTIEELEETNRDNVRELKDTVDMIDGLQWERDRLQEALDAAEAMISSLRSDAAYAADAAREVDPGPTW